MTDEAAVARRARGHVDVLVEPLFDEDGEEGGGKAQSEAHEPETIDPDDGGGFGFCGVRRKRREGNVVDGCAIQRSALEVDHLVDQRSENRIGGHLEGLGSLGDEGGDYSGEKTSLSCLARCA